MTSYNGARGVISCGPMADGVNTDVINTPDFGVFLKKLLWKAMESFGGKVKPSDRFSRRCPPVQLDTSNGQSNGREMDICPSLWANERRCPLPRTNEMRCPSLQEGQ